MSMPLVVVTMPWLDGCVLCCFLGGAKSDHGDLQSGRYNYLKRAREELLRAVFSVLV